MSARRTAHHQVPTDQKDLTDEAFFNGLDLDLPALRAVAAAWRAGDVPAADAAALAHFRRRNRPRITAYKTDRHWEDWPGSTVIERAEAVLPLPPPGTQGARPDARQYNIGVLHAAWQRTAAEKYARAIRRRITGFIEKLPFVLDPAFHPDAFSAWGGPAHPQLSGCYKLFSWADLLAGRLFRTPGVLPDEFWVYLLRHFWFHAAQYTRFIGAPFRCDNHHLMERGVACYFLGVQFPEFRRAAEMEASGRSIILRQFDYNCLPDGCGSEHCSSYQNRCFLRYAMADSVARANGRVLFDASRRARLRQWLLYQGLATAPDGRQPDIGDGGGPGLNFIISQSGAMYRSAELKGIAAALNLPDGPINSAFADAYAKVTPRLPRRTSAIYPHGGHLFLRDSWSPRANFMWMSLKNESLYDIHSHWDTLSFAIWARGRRLIGDPVTRTYGRARRLARGYYFSMDAHNCLIIDDDILSSHRALARAWGRQPPRITRTAVSFGDDFDYAMAAHDGYRPLIHRRDVVFVRGRYFLITDGITMDFRGFRPVFRETGDIRRHQYKQRLHFEEDVPVRLRKRSDSILTACRGGPNLLIVCEPFENLRLTVEVNPYFKSLRRGSATCRTADIFRGTIGPCFFSTIYRPFEGDPPAVEVISRTPLTGPYRHDRHHAVEIRDGDTIDYWILQRGPRPRTVEVDFGGVPVRTDAAAVFLSTRPGQRPTGFRVGGRFVELAGRSIRLPLRKPTRWRFRRR